MLTDHPPVGFLATTDGTRARAFFEGVLGLPFAGRRRSLVQGPGRQPLVAEPG